MLLVLAAQGSMTTVAPGAGGLVKLYLRPGLNMEVQYTQGGVDLGQPTPVSGVICDASFLLCCAPAHL